MPHDAVANLAKPGEIDEQPFLEERGERVVEVARFGEIPQFSTSSGASGADEKKLGTSPNRLATSRCKAVCLSDDAVIEQETPAGR